METRRRYDSDEATDTYRRFVETDEAEWDESDPYCELLRPKTVQGERVERVRIVDQPPTTGQLYLLNNAQRNSRLGGTFGIYGARTPIASNYRPRTSGYSTADWLRGCDSMTATT